MVLVEEVTNEATISSSSSDGSIIKRGFLSADGRPRLYGDEGSKEGSVTEEQRRKREEY